MDGLDILGADVVYGPPAPPGLTTTYAYQHSALSWLKQPAWQGGYPRWQVGLAGAFAMLGVGGGIYALTRRK